MCGDYYLVNKQTHFDKYTMPLLEEKIDALKQANVLVPSTCNLVIISCYWRWQGQMALGNWSSWESLFVPMEVFTIWFEECLVEILKVMDRMFVNLNFAKCYIDDIIIFNLTLKNHMHQLQEMFKIFKKYNLQFHPNKCHFFHIQVEYLGHMIYLGGLGVQKAKVKMISQVFQLTKISQLQKKLGLCNYYWRFIKGFNTFDLIDKD